MQERKKNADPDNSRTQSIFRRENGPESGAELQQDETFRAFFTSTVIDIPDDMRHMTGNIPMEEAVVPEPERKKGRWPWSRRKNNKTEPEVSEQTQDGFSADDSFATELKSDNAQKQKAPEQDFTTSFLGADTAEEQPKAEPVTILPQGGQTKTNRASTTEERSGLTAHEFMNRTAEQAVSVDELLSRISSLEGKPKQNAENTAQEEEPEETPQLRRLREQTAAAAAGKSRLDAMLADIYAHATEEVPESSMQLVDEGVEEPTHSVECSEQDAVQDTVEIELNLTAGEASEPVTESPEVTGEVSLLEEPEPEEQPEPEETDNSSSEPEPEQPEEPEEIEPTGEIRLDDDQEDITQEDVEDTKEVVVNHVVPQTVTEPEEADEPEEMTTAEIPEQQVKKHHGLARMLHMLGLDEADDEETSDEELSDESQEEPSDEPIEDLSAEDEDAQEQDEKPGKGWFSRLLHPAENLDEDEAASDETNEADETEGDTEEPLPVEEYNAPEDAPLVLEMLQKRCGKLTLFTAISGILTAALLGMDLLAQYGKGIVTGIDPISAPATWLCVNLILLAVCALLNGPALLQGVQSILPGQRPTVDGLSALAVFGALLQLLLILIFQNTFDPTKQTIFAGVAALTVFMGLLGKRMSAGVDQNGFASMTSGVEHSTAYRLEDRALAKVLCQGLEEDDPAVLLNRPGTILKGFVAQSAAPHHCDYRAVLLTRVLGGAALLGAVIDLVRGGSAVTAGTVLAGILCLGAPLGILVLQGVSTLMMQHAASRVGAVVPGWPAIEKLGEVDVLQVDASELFPPMCAYLDGIKTFQKERIDSAILYATSVLIAGCNTLGGLCRGMIENNTDILYPVKDLEHRVGRGYVAWCDHCRVVLGTRQMMQEEGIPLPALDYENRYSKNGSSHVLYLAVSGKLYAMFLFRYKGTRQVAHMLNLMHKENIRLLITAQDPTLTEKRIEEVYHLEPGFIKLLNGEEMHRLEPAVGYLPGQVGCMSHLGGFVSMAGGLRAAAGAEEAQRSSSVVQLVSTVVSVIIGLLLSVTGGLNTISLIAVLLYQLAWTVMSIAVVMTKKY